MHSIERTSLSDRRRTLWRRVNLTVAGIARVSYGVICYVLDTSCRARDTKRVPGTLSTNNALFVKLDFIGDFFLWLPYARRLVAHFTNQGHTITLLANAAWASFVAAEFPQCKVVPVDVTAMRTRLTYRRTILAGVRAVQWDCLVDCGSERRFWLGDAICRAANAKESIGFATNRADVSTRVLSKLSDRWFTKLCFKAHVYEGACHEALLHVLGAAQIPFAPAAHQDGDSRLRTAIIFPGASWDGRKWPIDRFAECANHLVKRGLRCIVAGGPADRAAGDKIRALAGVPVENRAGMTTLAELVDLVATSSIVVTNETSAAHIARYVGTPAVVIYGGGHFGRFLSSAQRDLHPAYTAMPCFGCDWYCAYPRRPGAPVKCIEAVAASSVKSLIDRAITAKRLDDARMPEGGNATRLRSSGSLFPFGD